MQRAFTLIEVLVVVGIIVTLMGLLLTVISVRPAHEAVTKSIIAQTAAAIDRYRIDHAYPLEQLAASSFSDSDSNMIASRNHDLRAVLAAQSEEFDVHGSLAAKIDVAYLSTSSEQGLIVYAF